MRVDLSECVSSDEERGEGGGGGGGGRACRGSSRGSKSARGWTMRANGIEVVARFSDEQGHCMTQEVTQ